MIMHGHNIIELWIYYPQVYTYTVECSVTGANYCLGANFNCACQTLRLLDNNFNPLKVDCRGKSPMHIIVWICLFGHAKHKTQHFY